MSRQITSAHRRISKLVDDLKKEERELSLVRLLSAVFGNNHWGPTQKFHERVDKMMSCLTTREKQLVRMRFGLETGRYETLESTGKRFGLTRERTRQIEAKAIRKLRLSEPMAILFGKGKKNA